MDLNHKRIFITGAASGLGRELAWQCAKNYQCHVIAGDIQNEALDQLVDEASKYGLNIQKLYFDVNNTNQHENSINNLFQSKLDLWFNNAGCAYVGDFLSQSTEQLLKMLHTNLVSLTLLTQFAAKKMHAQGGGRIVNIASYSGICPAPMLSVYSATKHGVVGLTKSLQEEFKQKQMLVDLTLVAPGFIKTAMTEPHIPKHLSWMMATTEQAAKNILKGIIKDQELIIPDSNGRWMNRIYKLSPKALMQATKVLTK